MAGALRGSSHGPVAAAAEEWRLGAVSPGWAAGVHGFTLVAGLAALIIASRGHWFVIDEWAFLTDRHLGDVRGLFVPHNEHWSTLPILLWRGLFAAVGLHSYWPYQLAATSRCSSLARSSVARRSALRITGTTSPCGASVATPR